jgi:hypothetical protein
MLLTLAIIFLVLWILGLIFHVLGGLIYIALVLAIIFGIWHLVSGGSKPQN